MLGRCEDVETDHRNRNGAQDYGSSRNACVSIVSLLTEEIIALIADAIKSEVAHP